MTVEAATYIHQLNALYPQAGDQRREGDDHIRVIKQTLINTWPNIKGQVTKSHTQLNATPHDKATLTQMLGARPILNNEEGQVTGAGPQGITFGWHTASNRIRYSIDGFQPGGGLLIDSEFTGGFQKKQSQGGFQCLPGGIAIMWGTFVSITNSPTIASPFSVSWPVALAQIYQGYAVPANNNAGGYINVSIENLSVAGMDGFANCETVGTRVFRWFAIGAWK